MQTSYKSFAITLLALAFAGVALAQDPTQSPPLGNASPPINNSSTAQVKSGGLSLGSIIVDGGSVFNSQVTVDQNSAATAFIVRGGNSGAVLGSFIRDIGATAQVDISGAGADPQIVFNRNGDYYSIGNNAGTFRISRNSALGTTNVLSVTSAGNTTITGTLNSGAITSTGGIAGTTGTFSGAVSGTTGTFTGVVTGAAPTLGTHLTTKTYTDAAVATKQNAVTGTCSAGNAIQVINADGTVTCVLASDNLGNHTATASLSPNANNTLTLGTTALRWSTINSVLGNFSGAVSVASLASTGGVSGTTGTFSGAVSGTTGTFSGVVIGATPTLGTHLTTKTYVDTADATKQNTVTGTCAVGSSIRVVNSDGTVTCQTDTGPDNLGNHTATTALAMGGNAITGANGVALTGGWVTIAGNNGISWDAWGGGWNMQDVTWIRAYGGKSIYTTGSIRGDNGIQVDGRTMISSTGATHTAQQIDDLNYGVIEVRNNTGTRGGYLGWGNGSTRIDLIADAATQIYINDPVSIGTATVSGTLLLDVAGQVGATAFCDDAGANCYTTAQLATNGDNLGNHTATAALAMGGNAISGVNGITLTGDWVRVAGNNGILMSAWGGGWNMTDSTWMRSYADKAIYTGGEIRGSLFSDAGNSAYYADPAGTSVLNASTFAGTVTLNGITTANSQLDVARNSTNEIETTGDTSQFEIRQANATAGDSYITFHNASRYALNLGLDAQTNSLAVGGWSMGAVKYRIWHEGNDGASSTLDADLLDGYDSAALLGGSDNLGNHTATTALTMGGNAINNSGSIGIGVNPGHNLDIRGSMRQVHGTTYDVWIQGDVGSVGGNSRNLALLGTDQDSGDTLYVNHSSEYAGGTIIGGPVTINGSASVTNGVTVTGDWFRIVGNNGIYWNTHGGGWNMTDSTWIRAYGDKGIITNNQIRGTQFIDNNDPTNYYVDPNSVSWLNDVRGFIWYDRDNTGYYLNANGTSVLNTLLQYGNTTYNNGSPTLYFQDTDHRSAMIHVNSNLFYVLRGCGTNVTSWCTWTNGYWPLTINLENNDATFGGNVAAFSFTYISDRNQKKDITPFTDSRDILKLGVYNYTLKANNNEEFGVIAQEVEKYFPVLVKTDDKGMKSVDYPRLVVPMLGLVKEQEARINSLEKTVTELSKKVDALSK